MTSYPHSFHLRDAESGTQVYVSVEPRGFVSVFEDTDADQVIDLRVFKDEAQAVAYAKTLVVPQRTVSVAN
jgi:hypothetical protein